MEQIRQILAQLALNLDLNIAMCDMIEKQGKRLDDHDKDIKVLQTKVNSLSTRVSELFYAQSTKAYDDRTAGKKGKI